MAGWEEVRQLANDFQRVQQGSTAQRLSERNCIEIITNLMKMKLLDVIYTTDGKEYITPQHLVREIRDEILVHGGRVNIVDIAQALNVNLNHVETSVKDITKMDPSLQFVLGQLINSEYITSLADDMNERLQEKGVINISDLPIVFDLPAEFILSVVDANLGSRIHGQRDPNNSRIFLTDWLIARHRAVLRGALNGSCRPVSIQSLIKQHSLNERLVSVVVEELVSLGEVAGSFSGQGRKDKATFVPHVYITAQNAWIDAFLKSNSYIPFDAVKKLDIADPKSFLKNRYSATDFLFLDSCIIPKSILERVEGGVEDVLSSGSWTEANTLFPSGLEENDIAAVVDSLIAQKKFKDVRVIDQNFIVAQVMFEDSRKRFESTIDGAAEEEATKQAAVLMAAPVKASAKENEDDESVSLSRKNRKDDRQKRQTGSKNQQKAGKARKSEDGADDNETESNIPEVFSLGRIIVELQKMHDGAPYELVKSIAEHIKPDLVSQYRRVLDVKAKTIISSSVTDRKQSHKSAQDQISTNILLLRLFCQGIEQFHADADKKLLYKHLLRNIGPEILNPLVIFAMDDFGLPAPEKLDLTHEARVKLIAKFPEPLKSSFDKCNNAAAGDSVDIFENSLYTVLENEAIGMPLKKSDKKRETQICQEHRQQLLDGISSAKDIATALRLCCLALFLKATTFPLEAPGKFVPQIFTFLRSHLSPEQLGILENCRDKLQGSGSPEDLQECIENLSLLAQHK